MNEEKKDHLYFILKVYVYVIVLGRDHVTPSGFRSPPLADISL